ncbi:hemolysin family protein [Agrococcus sediminis]|uniref:hemolysin family protein n=1 Tax=Agrococcus TaxID=46352 RepID=UPI000FE3B595|nr:hemolysin family protein [Agrococcus sp. BE272]MDR7234483.1 CBS domain containing-hemolysin-like protein [Agrococcus sp. BE272]RWR25531.1 HlyC/CorC family transporter [Agrococcus lahaulensis]
MFETVLFVVAALLIAFGAWLAACDAALGVVSRAELQMSAMTARRSRAMLAIADDLRGHLMTLQFGRIMCETIAAVLITLAVDSLVTEWWITLLIAAGVMIVVSFVLVGTSPRAVGRTHAIALLRASAGFLRFWRVLMGPVAILVATVGDKVTPGRQRETAFTTEAQLLSMVDAAAESDVLEDDDRELIHSIFEFNETLVREVMVPRPDMIVVDRDTTATDALRQFLDNGLSRMPVVGESTDEVDGILYLRDVVRSRTWRPDATETAGELARPALLVPESKKADDTLALMQAERVHVAMVVDEYGGIAGLVTLEDLVEELVGEIHDEHDRGRSEVVEAGDDVWRVSARLQIDELGDLFDLTLDDEDVDTVGGLVQKELGRITEVGDVVHVHGLRIEVRSLDGRGRNAGEMEVSRQVAAAAEPEGAA